MPKTDTKTDKEMARELREEAARLERQGKALLQAADALEGKQ
jgi:hypothetical protein